MHRERSRSPSRDSKCKQGKVSTLKIDDISVAVQGDQVSWTQAAAIFRKYGVVILMNLISTKVTNLVLKSLRDLYEQWGAKYDPEKIGNRLPGRYDMGSAYNTQHLTHLPGYLEALEDFAQKGGLNLLEQLGGYKFVGGQGQLVLAHTDNWQPLHGDYYSPWHEDLTDEPEHVACAELMFTVHPLTSTNGAMRILPGQPSWDKMYRQTEFPPPKLDAEPETYQLSQLFPLPAGCGILRDIRIWHGGVPNTSNEDRHIPVLQFYSNRVLSLCSSCASERGRGVDEDEVKAKLSAKTQDILAQHIVRRRGDDMPWLEGKYACWPGTFSY
eukprot:TRINITY_DN88014_c0_g1_i1.p1 TRINITY_DN88014_c0_g1~~TRINITY_DN88014_c0_g1_i1.p1  ORF type:complete len:327 (-),score=40.73 TRINITY_DN88014_c0_g1_i1:380-1360(-)